jgi:hypothetical protein
VADTTSWLEEGEVTLAVVGAGLMDQLFADPTLVELGVGSKPKGRHYIIVQWSLANWLASSRAARDSPCSL